MFWLLHLAAVVFFLPALFVTIPLHIITAVLQRKNRSDEPHPDSHVHCPDCREFVRKDAKKCKHCGCPLIPQG